MVISIVGVLGAIAVANYTDAVKLSRARQQAYDVRAWIQKGRNLARLTNHCVEVTRDGASLSLIEAECDGSVLETQERTFSLVEITGPSSELVFGTKGEVRSGETILFDVAPQYAPSQKRQLMVMPFLGTVRMQ